MLQVNNQVYMYMPT